MSTGLIVLIVVIAIIVIAVLALLPRMRAKAAQKKTERELTSRRETAAEEHRQAATARESRAEEAEQRARLAEEEARRERAEANIGHERASMHERGLADHELIEEEERERFEGVAGPDRPADPDAREPQPGIRSGTTDESEPGIRSGTTDERKDERFERTRLTDDVKESDRSRTS